MKKEEKFLKKRATEFWQRAKEDFKKGRFNLSALDVEQAIQLFLKHLIFVKAGDFPKTHNFGKLFDELSEIYNSKEIKNFYEDHILEFKALEDAYITSRYFPREFEKIEVEKIIEFAQKVIKFLEDKTGEKFR
jgi:HEPN domain-containing protein